MAFVPPGAPYFLVIKSTEGLNSFLSSWFLFCRDRSACKIIVVFVEEKGRSHYERDPSVWIPGHGRIQYWINTLDVLVQAILMKTKIPSCTCRADRLVEGR